MMSRSRIAVAITAIYLLLCPWTTLWERDEPRYARAAVEMVHSGDLLVPTVNEDVRARKPPLMYWLMAIGVWSLGQREVAVRCWSPLAVGLMTILTHRLGRRLFGDRAGLVAMLIVAVNPMMALQGMAATTDAVLLAAITAAVVFGAEGLLDGVSATRWLAVACAVGVAQLTKGPIGLVLPWLVLAPLAYVRRGEGGVGRLGMLTLAMAAGAVPYLAWLVAADSATGGLFTRESLGREVLARVLGPLEGHGGERWLGLPYYLAVIAIGFAPGSVWLPMGIARLRTMEDRHARVLLLAWLFVPTLGFSLSATRLPHYVLPAWPALALIVAGAAASDLSSSTRERRWIAWASLVSAWTLAASALVLAAVVPIAAARLAAFAVGAVLVIGGGAAWWLARRGQTSGSLFASVGTAGVTLFLCAMSLAPSLEPLKISPRLAAMIRGAAAPSVPISTFDYEEPGLDFYLDRAPIGRLGSPADVDDWAGRREPGLLVLTDDARRRLVSGRSIGRMRVFGRVHGFDYVKGRWLDVVVVSRAGEER